MTALTREQAIKIAEITSSVYQQGATWVFEEHDWETGATRLSRGFSEKDMRRKLKAWRKERIEQLLRSNPSGKAFTIRVWHENPSWNGQGVWRWAQNHWYLTRDEAEAALEKQVKKDHTTYDIFELPISELPGHFVNR
jgi:hypothetical protein